MFPLAFVAGWLQGHRWGFFSRNYVVWPTFFLMNVFIALKGSHFWFYICIARQKDGQGQPRVIIWTGKYSRTQCCISNFKVIGLLIPKKKTLVFYYIWAWSCDFNILTNFHYLPTSHSGSIWNSASIGLVFVKFENVACEWPWIKVNEIIKITGPWNKG